MKLAVRSLMVVVALAVLGSNAWAKRAKTSQDQSNNSTPALVAPSSGGLSSTPWGKDFGLGLQLGDHSGITGKLRLESNTALVFGVGAGWTWAMGSGLELSVGYLVHPSLLASYKSLRLSWYIGGVVDVMLLSGFNKNYIGVISVYGSSPIGLGAHVPVGLDFQLRALPISIYFEATPGVDLFPAVGPRLGLALGGRFFF